jgi:hypothetical protein
MFESYKLKKAKAKLELSEVKKQLNEIEAQKEKERWEQMPQWEKNIETEILRDKLGLSNGKEHSPKYSAIMAGIWTIVIEGAIFAFLYLVFVWSAPPPEPVYYPGKHSYAVTALNSLLNSNEFFIYGIIGLLLSSLYVYIELYYIYRRGYGH